MRGFYYLRFNRQFITNNHQAVNNRERLSVVPLIILYQIVYFIGWIELLIEQSLKIQYNIILLNEINDR